MFKLELTTMDQEIGITKFWKYFDECLPKISDLLTHSELCKLDNLKKHEGKSLQFHEAKDVLICACFRLTRTENGAEELLDLAGLDYICLNERQ